VVKNFCFVLHKYFIQFMYAYSVFPLINRVIHRNIVEKGHKTIKMTFLLWNTWWIKWKTFMVVTVYIMLKNAKFSIKIVTIL